MIKMRSLLKEDFVDDTRFKSNINSAWKNDDDIINDIKLLLLIDYDNANFSGMNDTIASIMKGIKEAKQELLGKK